MSRSPGKHLTSPTPARLLHLTPDIPPQWRPLTPDPRLTTRETSLGYFPFSAARLFSSRPLAECCRLRRGERYPGIFQRGLGVVQVFMPPHLSSSKAIEPLSSQVTVKQCVTHPHPEATASFCVLPSECRAARSLIQQLIFTSSTPADNENIHIKGQHACAYDITQARRPNQKTPTFLIKKNTAIIQQNTRV